MATYLVTGGAGFIGSNLVKKLLHDGHTVRVLDDFSTGHQQNLSAFESDIRIIKGDLRNLATVKEAVKGVEVVLHQGAVPSVPKSIADPILSNEVTVTGTLNVLVAARDAGVRRLVFASSSSIYGEQAPDAAKVETMNSQPISPYGVAKLAAEKYCQVFYQVYGFETVALRYFNVFGPQQDPQSMYAAVIPKFITMMLADKSPTIFGDGEQTRDYTYIGNVVAGNLLAAMAPIEKVGGQVINLAAGGRISLNTLMEMLQEITGKQIDAIYDPPRPGDILHSSADIDKARERLGYSPEISLLDGLKSTIDWYANNSYETPSS